MKKKTSIRWKIGKYLFVFAAGLIGLLFLFQVVLLEPVGLPDAEPFPNEFPHMQPRAAQAHHRYLVGLLVAHQHLGLDAVRFCASEP